LPQAPHPAVSSPGGILFAGRKETARMLLAASGAVSDDPFSQAGTHFTSYQAEQYPDLAYAAEMTVKAV